MQYVLKCEKLPTKRYSRNLFRKKIKNLLVFLYVLDLFIQPSVSLGLDQNEEKVAREYSLDEIKGIASKFNITITDWQNYNYQLKLDEQIINNRDTLVEWLKKNLHNWALEEKQLMSRFFLLPYGIETKDFLTIKNLSKNADYKNLFKEAEKNYLIAKPISETNILELQEIHRLSIAAEKEKNKRLFYSRSIASTNTQNEYAFSVAYNNKENKLLPYELNGAPVTENKIEGFLCYNTVLKYIQSNISKLEAKRSNSWLFLNIKDISDSFIGLRITDTNLDIVSQAVIGSKPILQYYIQSSENGFNSSTSIFTSDSDVILNDSVIYFEGAMP